MIYTRCRIPITWKYKPLSTSTSVLVNYIMLLCFTNQWQFILRLLFPIFYINYGRLLVIRHGANIRAVQAISSQWCVPINLFSTWFQIVYVLFAHLLFTSLNRLSFRWAQAQHLSLSLSFITSLKLLWLDRYLPETSETSLKFPRNIRNLHETSWIARNLNYTSAFSPKRQKPLQNVWNIPITSETFWNFKNFSETS